MEQTVTSFHLITYRSNNNRLTETVWFYAHPGVQCAVISGVNRANMHWTSADMQRWFTLSLSAPCRQWGMLVTPARLCFMTVNIACRLRLLYKHATDAVVTGIHQATVIMFIRFYTALRIACEWSKGATTILSCPSRPREEKCFA